MINKVIKYFTKYPLAHRITIIVILTSFMLTVITAILLTISDYQTELKNLKSRLEQVESVEIPSLTKSLWHLNREQIESQLLGILNLQDITYEQLEIYGGETIVLGHVVDENNALTQSYLIEFSQNETSYELGRLTVVADLNNLQQRVKSRLFINLLISTIQVFLLAGIILFVIDRLFTKPLIEVIQFAEKLDLDHLNDPLILHKSRFSAADNELDLVARRLNELLLRLKSDLEEQKTMAAALIESENKYREIFNATNEAIIIQDASDGTVLQVNNTMLTMFGYSEESEVIGRSVDSFSSNRNEFTKSNANKKIQKTRTGEAQIFEWQARKKNGDLFWVEISIRNVTINRISRILAVIRDITESKRNNYLLQSQNEELLIQRRALEDAEAQLRELNLDLEKRVKERTIQLADLNEELESFSYSVAHDLKAPLRNINAYSTIILHDYRNDLDVTVLGYIENILSTTKKMTGLIEDLLKLSKVNRSEIKPEKINLTPLALDILNGFQRDQPDRQVEISVATLLSATADPNLIVIALDNLLRNAWKFTSKLANARIEVGCFEKDEKSIFFVRDNGVGFEQIHAEKMFKPFERLHSSKDFEGTGIGLAITKRIITRHHGRIWAEGEPEKGATIYFTLSDNQ